MKTYTPTEVADRMGCSVQAVRLWLKQGRFPGAIPPAREWRIPEEALEQFIKPEPVGRPKTNPTTAHARR